MRLLLTAITALVLATSGSTGVPKRVALTAAALRQGWWRRSCQEKVRSRASMACIVAAGVGSLGF